MHCDECVKKVSPFLDAIPGVYKWNVELASSNKILTVTGDHLRVSEIKTAVKKAGYQIHSANSFFSGVISSLVKGRKKDCCE